MSIALLQALGIAVAGISSVGAVLIVLLLLNSKAGPWGGAAFAGGYWSCYVAIGSLSLYLGRGAVEVDDGGGPTPVKAVLFTCLGVLMLFFAIKSWRASSEGEASPPKFLSKVDGFSPLKALGFGLLVPLINFKNLALFLPAIAVLAEAELAVHEAALSVLLIALVFCAGVLSPLVIIFLLPKRSKAWLAAMRRWIETHSRTIPKVVLPLIGTVMLIKGGQMLWTLYGG